MKIAVVDDNPDQAALICQALSALGHSCHSFGSSAETPVQLQRDSVDLLVIDCHTRDMNAVELVRRARERLPAQVPILFMTGGSDPDDIVAGWTAGANDCIVKPIRRGELAVRVQALLRQAYPDRKSMEQVRFGEYVFEALTGRLSLNGNEIEVTQKEFNLALLFFRNLGRPLSRAYILEAVWAHDAEIPSRTMDTHVSRVRSKLRLRPEYGFRLAPVYSYGYRLEQIQGS